MTALDRNPATNNQLLPNRFRFFLKRAPNLEFWIQTVAIPGFSIESAEQPTPFVKIPWSGDLIDYQPLGVSMMVDSELANYFEIYNWMRGLGKPDNFTEYAQLLEAPKILDEGVKSEIVVTLLNGQQIPKYAFTFHGAFPTALSGFELDVTAEGLDRVICHAQFAYTSFTLEPMNVPVQVDVGLN